jgi:methylmalonyl-CoA/ethylmalonyl-CoA epimerase
VATIDETKSAPFSTLHHVTIVVRDIERAVEFYESVGFGPFVEYPPLTDYVKLNVIDVAGFHDVRFKCAQVGPIQIQLCQPGGGRTTYREFLEKKGEGVFHLGFVVDDVDDAEAELKASGLGVLSSGRRQDGSGFSYMDTADEAGVVLLVRQSPGAKENHGVEENEG